MTRKISKQKDKRSRADKAVAKKMLDRLRTGADSRTRKVRRLGAAIRAGRYENPFKLHIALDRVLENLD